MERFKPYGFRDSKYPLWSERDTKWAYRDQLNIAIILVFMLVGVAGVFLYFNFRFGAGFWAGIVLTAVVATLGMLPLWKYAKSWVKSLEGTFYLRARSDDAGYKLLKENISTILDETGIDYRIIDGGFQAILGTFWMPEKDIITFSGPLKIVELTFDITAEEGLEITLNSLSKFPGLENKIIPGLSALFSINPDGVITAKSG